MNRFISISVLLSTLILSSLIISGCSNKKTSDTTLSSSENVENTDISLNSDNETSTITEISTESETNHSETDSDNSESENFSDNQEKNSDNNQIIETYTEIIYETEEKSVQNTAESNEFEYNLSDDKLISLAQEKYTQAIEIYTDFVYNGHYNMDYSKLYFSSDGESMLLITDSSIKSITDVLDDYAQYFSEKYENPIPLHYIEQGNSVYYIQSDRGSDATYLNTEIKSITKKESNEIFFEAVSSYSDGSTIKDEFSLVYNENNIEWKIGIFTLPN